MRFPRRLMLAGLLALAGARTFAGEQAFDQKSFDDLRAAHKPVVVFVHADWCPTCKRQQEILDSLLAQSPYQAVTVLRVDYDTQKAEQKALGVAHRSTLIAFKDGTEAERSVADTQPNHLAALLRKAL